MPSATEPGNLFTSKVTREKVSFPSSGVTCAAYLYRPGASGDVPCVVMAHGFSGTMDRLFPHAEKFAAAGMAVLVFDYRHFGESEGQPRQLIDVARQRDDLQAAIRFARTLPGVDPERIALWGTSLGGGHVIAVAATDPRLAAVVAQVPGIDMVRREGRGSIEVPLRVKIAILVAAVRDAIRGLLGRPPYLLPIFGQPGLAAPFTDPALAPYFEALMRDSTSWRNEFTPRFYLALPRYRNGTAERLVMPLLVCVAERDIYASPTFATRVARQAPRGEVRRYPVEHFDVYHGEVFDRVVADQASFLRAHLS